MCSSIKRPMWQLYAGSRSAKDVRLRFMLVCLLAYKTHSPIENGLDVRPPRTAQVVLAALFACRCRQLEPKARPTSAEAIPLLTYCINQLPPQ